MVWGLEIHVTESSDFVFRSRGWEPLLTPDILLTLARSWSKGPTAAAAESYCHDLTTATAALKACKELYSTFYRGIISGLAITALEEAVSAQHDVLLGVAYCMRRPLRVFDLRACVCPGELLPLGEYPPSRPLSGDAAPWDEAELRSGFVFVENAAAAGHLHIVQWLLPRHASTAPDCSGTLALQLLWRALSKLIKPRNNSVVDSRPIVEARLALVQYLFRAAVAGGADVNLSSRRENRTSREPLVHVVLELFGSQDDEDLVFGLQALRWLVAQPEARSPPPTNSRLSCLSDSLSACLPIPFSFPLPLALSLLVSLTTGKLNISKLDFCHCYLYLYLTLSPFSSLTILSAL